MPALAWEALVEKPVEPFDILIVDEAQDLMTLENLDVFELILRDGLRKGRWHLYLDPNQNIYDVEVLHAVDTRLSEGSPALVDLYENCRNTKQVATQTSIISGIDLAIEGAPNGLEAKLHHYHDTDDAITMLDVLLRDLIDRDVRPEEIAILSTRRRKNSILAGVSSLAGRDLAGPNDEVALARGALLVSTMHAFKGLDRQVVIAIDMKEIGEESWSMLHYAGLSRARGLLHVLMPNESAKKYDRQAVAYGSRIGSRRN